MKTNFHSITRMKLEFEEKFEKYMKSYERWTLT